MAPFVINYRLNRIKYATVEIVQNQLSRARIIFVLRLSSPSQWLATNIISKMITPAIQKKLA